MISEQFFNSEKAAQEVSKRLIKVIEFHEIEENDQSNCIDAYLNQKKDCLFLNEFIPISSSPLTIVGEVPKGMLRDELPIAAMLWFWNNYLCPMYTLTLWWKKYRRSENFSLRLFLPEESEEFQSFCKTKTQILLIRNKKHLYSLSLNAANLDDEFWTLLDNRSPKENVGDIHASKILINYNVEKPRSPTQVLQLSWAKWLEGNVSVAVRFFNDKTLSEKRNSEFTIVENSPFASYFSKRKPSLSWIYGSMAEGFENLGVDLLKMIRLPSDKLAEAPHHQAFIGQIMLCAWFSSGRTNCGLSFTSFGLDRTIQLVNIDTEALGQKVDVFWERLPLQYPFYFLQLFGPGSCPADPHSFFKSLPLYHGVVEEGWDFVRSLLAEATALKRWTIPFGAYVHLEVSDVIAVKLYELGDDIACVFINNAEDYYLVWINPLSETFSFSHEIDMGFIAAIKPIKKDCYSLIEDEQAQYERIERLKLALIIPLAAIIRDFWVVEERVKVFGRAKIEEKVRLRTSNQKPRSIIYLPRVRYVNDIKRLAEPLHLQTRRPHFVTGHLRRATEASEKQIFLARKCGIVVPEGFTFVKPHRRGDKAQETIYRSRSALQCIRALRPIDAGDTKDAWFTFELNVRDWLKGNGFEVEHIAGNRNGDGGVDIQAHKGDEILLIQCKYWRTEKIGPAVIRELLGTLQAFPKETKGVLITSTELTRGAQKLARKNGIEYLQNINFNQEIDFMFS